MIDKNELIKLLPKLIREDDEIKGAIISALSGVVSTKDDIARIIENSNRRFEAMQVQMDKRFEAMQVQMDKRFEAMQVQIDKRFKQVDERFEAIIVQMNKGFEDARIHREALEASQMIIRKNMGEFFLNYATKEDIENANKEILDYLKQQFEE